MKHRYKKKLFAHGEEDVFTLPGTEPGVHADSPEVLYIFYCDKLMHLEKMLENLNLLEHPCEIEFICGRIILVKKKLQLLEQKIK